MGKILFDGQDIQMLTNGYKDYLAYLPKIQYLNNDSILNNII